MQKLILSFFILFFTVACIAQGNLPRTYDYDNAGNRILRTTVRLRQTVAADADTSFADVSNSKQEPYYEEIVGENNVKVYPNPTKGMVTLQFEKTVKTGFYRLSDFSGKLLSDGIITNSIVTLDLTRYENGVYLLTLTLDGQTDTWKIIKQ